MSLYIYFGLGMLVGVIVGYKMSPIIDGALKSMRENAEKQRKLAEEQRKLQAQQPTQPVNYYPQPQQPVQTRPQLDLFKNIPDLS